MSPFSQMSDRGGGVPQRKIERLFSYMYSTAPTPQPGTGGTPLVRWHHLVPPLTSLNIQFLFSSLLIPLPHALCPWLSCGAVDGVGHPPPPCPLLAMFLWQHLPVTFL